jgi:N-acetylneuraminic acid mutarotase
MCVVSESNGAVLVAGGFDSIGSALASAEFALTRSAPRMREPRAAAAHATVGADVYVAGGIGAHHEAVRTAEYFDAATEEWVELPPMPRARAHCAGAALGLLAFYVVGGTEQNGRPASSVFALDITTRAWTEVPSPTMGECSATTISFGA